jgi:hypothetical protein
MNERDDHTFALLEAANPVAADDLRRELGEAGLDAARARVDRRLELTGDTEAPPRLGPTARHSWSRRRLRLAGAAAACLGAGVVALAVLPEGNGRLSALDAVAAVAAAQPAPRAPAGSYTHLRERQGGRIEPWPAGLVAGPLPSTAEFWIGPDGSGRVIRTMKTATGETPTGDGWKRTGDTWTNDQRFGANRFSTVYRNVRPSVLDLRVDTLPTEPNTLAAQLRQELAEAAADDDPETGFAGGSHASSGELLIVIGQTLAHPLARPELRSALYEVAGTLEGVEVDEHGHDPSGRPAAVISLDETAKSGTANRSELFFDPRTSALLATQSTTVEFVPAGPIATPDPPGGTPIPTPDPARTQPADPDASDCGTVEDPCPAKVAPIPPSEGDNDPDVRTTFTYFAIYDQRGTVDSIHARP